MKTFAVTVFSAVLIAAQPSAQASDDAIAAQIDVLFSQYNHTIPGCAVGVEHNGKSVFSKGYGMADLEHDIPITPQSMFYMASVSKQFTALTVLLLIDDGKLQLTDSVRKFIPELPHYADDITIYQLLTHTSGIRDYLPLHSLAGLSPEAVITDDYFLKLLSRQQALNFSPGTAFSYSNSGYVLLSLVVKRLTGERLDSVARQKIFDPLGMKHSLFEHDHSALVPAKAVGYTLRRGAWHTTNSMLDVAGDGGLYSSIDDMMLWMRNIDAPTVGTKELAIMETPGRLKDGSPINYGMGLQSSVYRGLQVVEHSGGFAGYRTDDLWFPQQWLSVVVLCNNGSADPTHLAKRVAEVYLSAEMTATHPAENNIHPLISLDEREIKDKVGLYRNENGNYAEITERDGKLYAEGRETVLEPISKYQFLYQGAPDNLLATFDRRSPSAYLETVSGGPAVRYERVVPVRLSERERREYDGDYDSRELNVTYHISSSADALSLTIGDHPPVLLRSTGPDRMLAGPQMEIPLPAMELLFTRDPTGNVLGFSLSAGRAGHFQFRRVPSK